MRVHSLSLESHSRLQQLARDHAAQCQNVGFKSVPVQQIFYNPHKLLQPHKSNHNLWRSRSIGFTTRVFAVPFSGIARASQVVDYLQVEWPWDEPLRWGPGGSDILTIQGYRPSKFKVLFAPTERASGCKNFPRAGITAISNSSFPSMFSRMVMTINSWGGIGVLAGYFIQVSVWTVQTSGSFTLGVI